MGIDVKNGKKKVRVNVTVDKRLLNKAKKQLDMFGGKLSTLFNAYLRDFVTSVDKRYNENKKGLDEKFKEVEERLKKLEKRRD
jgi:hypothetical protein